MKLIITGFMLAALTGAAFNASAANESTVFGLKPSKSDISWNYVNAGYTKITIDNYGYDYDLNGYQVGASYLLHDNLYIRASYYDTSGDIDFFGDAMGLELEASEFQAALGLRQGVTDNIDSFFEAGYARSEVGLSGFEKTTLNNFHAAAGFRYLIISRLELGAALRYNNGSDVDSSTYGDITARFRITNQFDIYMNYQFDSDASVLGTGVMFNF